MWRFCKLKRANIGIITRKTNYRTSIRVYNRYKTTLLRFEAKNIDVLDTVSQYYGGSCAIDIKQELLSH